MLSGFVRTDQSDVPFVSTSSCKELRQGVPGRRQQRGQRRRRRCVGSATWALSISTTVLFDDAHSSDISPCRPRCSRRPPQHHDDYQQVAASSTSSVGSLGSVGSAHATTRLVSTALFVATARAPATSGHPSGRRRRPSPGAPCWGPGGYRRVGPARARHTPRRNRTRPTLTWST